MTTQLPLDDRATCAELFDFACTFADILAGQCTPYSHDAIADLLARFQTLRDDINEGENA